MLKVLLVDDEPIITIGLKKLINWKELELEIVGEARDGEEALILTEELRPDIILTDILMAGMSGIDFIKTMKETEFDSRIIILSGHSEFEYAKEALKHNVFEYLVKPVHPELLKDTLLLARESILAERADKKNRVALEQNVRENMPILQERFICQLLKDETITLDEIEAKSALFGMNLVGEGYSVVSIALENPGEVSGFQDEKGQILLRFGVMNVASEVTQYYSLGYVVLLENEMYIIVVHETTDNKNPAFNIARTLQSRLADIFGLVLTIGIGKEYKTVTEIHRSYSEAKDILKYKFYLEKGAILTIDDLQVKKYRRLYNFKYESEILENISYNIPIDSEQSALKLVDNFVSRSKNQSYLIGTYCFEFFIRLRNIMEIDDMVDNPLPDIIHLNEEIRSITNIYDLKTYVKGKLNACVEAILVAKKRREYDVVAEAKTYMDANLDSPITLNSIANQVHISPTYFCSLFKIKTGIGFHEYLLKIRMEKAAKYLLGGNYKVYEISNMVGYKNPRYFSEAFKKYYGVIPTEYK
jgi:two-component system response regulator YesN